MIGHGSRAGRAELDFALLHAPYGVCNGFFTITLGYLLSHAGVGTEAIAGIAALCLFPLTWSVVWAPVVDFTLSYRAWYVIGTSGTALGIAAASLLPHAQSSVLLLSILAFGASLSSTFTAQVTGAFAAHGEGKKGGAASWFMAGSIGGIGAGGGLALWLAEHVPTAPWLAGACPAVFCLLCCTGLLWLDEPEHPHRVTLLSDTLANMWRALVSLMRSRQGIIVSVMLVLPIGSGAAGNLWSAVSGDWHAGADLVALATGVAAGGASAAGALAMGWICDRAGARQAYVTAGVVMALLALAMAAAPRTPQIFAVFTLAYAFSNGAMYAGFAAAMLESIGPVCAATKVPLLTCFTNVPILVMTLVDGRAQTRLGSGGMLVTEAVVGLAAVLLFLLFAAWMGRRIPLPA